MSILDVKNMTHTVGDKKLFSEASMSLYGGDKLGLTGLNGAGKSTFINILISEVVPDSGFIKWNPRSRLGYLDQQVKVKGSPTVREHLLAAFQPLFTEEKRLEEIQQKIGADPYSDEIDDLLEQMGDIQYRLDAAQFYDIPSVVDKTAEGLGLVAFGLDTPLAKLSGGQRAKVMLAKLLLEAPDVLLLDEPTNFLDTAHIDWLAKYLQNFKGSFILVSHDFTFLNRVVNCICDIDSGKINRYNGTYESFVKQKEQKRADLTKSYASQQKEIAELKDYVARNMARASTSNMAKSRQKKLEKIELIDKPVEYPTPTFSFPYKSFDGMTLLTVRNLSVGYAQPLLPNISLVIQTGQRLAVTGFNGIGKSTFFKTLCGIIPALGGDFVLGDKTVIGYYEQDNIFADDQLNPIQQVREYYPLMEQKQIRSQLGRCGLRGEQALQPIATLSGGEQAKVKICRLSLSPCNLLILDEPTNHLDIKAIERLKVAIAQFQGGVLFVSHSREFVAEVATDVLDLEKLFE